MSKAIPEGMAFLCVLLMSWRIGIFFFCSFKAWGQLAFLIPVMGA